MQDSNICEVKDPYTQTLEKKVTTINNNDE